MSSVQTSLVSATAYLEIEGARYTISGFDITYVAGGISYANAHLAVGRQAAKSGKDGAGFLPHLRGVPAKVILVVDRDVSDPVSRAVLLRGGTFTAFDGLYDDAGPGNLSKGSFNIKANLTSKLARLNTGALQLGKLIPRTYLDTTISLSPFNKKIQNISPVGQGFTATELTNDFWTAMKRVLTDIASGGAGKSTTPEALKEFVAFFGGELNTTAASALKEIGGSLRFGPIRNNDIILSITSYLNTLFTGDFRYESFLSRINNLGQEFKYRLIESFKGLKVVPYSPFFSAADAVEVTASSSDAAEWIQREPNSVEGVAFLLAGPNFMNNNHSGQPFMIGRYKRPSKLPLGAVLSLQCPAWMSRQRDMAGSKGFTFVGDRTVAEQIGNGYAKETCLDLAYRGRGLQVSCPLRTDIGLLTPVKVLYPDLPGTNGSTAVYGSVQMVKLTMDTVLKRAGTVMEVGYARSQALQAAELEGHTHPVWATQYRGGRLDE